MIRVKEGAIYLRFKGPKDELELIADATKVRPPSYWRSDAYQLWQITDGKKGWDGYIRILSWDKQLLVWRCMRGHSQRIFKVAEELNIELDLTEMLTSPFEGVTVDDIDPDLLGYEISLDDKQRGCIASWLSSGIGFHKMAVSSGKTFTFANAAASVKRRFSDARCLYITPTERLVNQVYTECRKFLPDWHITQFGGGKRDWSGKDMVVATAASIHTNFAELSEEKWFRTFMVLLVDEAHHLTSESWSSIMLATPAYFRFGASDTTKEKDEMATLRIEGHIGPVLRRVEINPLIEVGRVAKPTIYVVDYPEWTNKFAHLNHVAKPETSAWVLLDNKWVEGVYEGPVYVDAEPDKSGNFLINEEDGIKKDRKGEPITVQNLHTITVDDKTYEMESRWCILERLNDMGITKFKERNSVITSWAKHFHNQGWPTVVIATRTLHVLILHALIAKAIGSENVRVLFSDHSTKERDETFEWLRKTPGAILVSPLVKEGVSINELRAGIIADHVVSWEVASQMIGRFVRKKFTGENTAKIVMILDRQHPRLRRNGMALIESLEKIRGYTFVTNIQGPDTIDQGIVHNALDFFQAP